MDLYASITAVIGFNLKIGSNLSGTISEEYMIGVKNCHAIDTILNIYATSLIYTVTAQAAIEALKTDDFVYLHVEASDEAGHEGDVPLKMNIRTRCLQHIYQMAHSLCMLRCIITTCVCLIGPE